MFLAELIILVKCKTGFKLSSGAVSFAETIEEEGGDLDVGFCLGGIEGDEMS